MHSLLVTYDLRGRDETSADYAELIRAIKRYRHGKLMLSTWFVVTNRSAEEVFDDLRPHVDQDDRLLVVPIGRPSKFRKLIDTDAFKVRP
ncbi:MAG: hypothetical protein M3320_00175 [Actinomycetota bacterium]|nr:hypothetical protein [Actinomycetota bacterium]MDQ5807072.1 hypothetical protein [Actinomycetota bacterium]